MSETYLDKCPRCLKDNVGAKVVGAYRSKISENMDVVMLCNYCSSASIVEIHRDDTGGSDWNSIHMAVQEGLIRNHIHRIYPSIALDVPDHLPESIEASFRNGLRIMEGDSNNRCMAFRACLEKAMKVLRPDEKGSLYSRIEQMGNEGELPKTLVGWLHQLRMYGNTAAHELEAEIDDAKAAEAFLRLFLTYTFTLPRQLEIARERTTS